MRELIRDTVNAAARLAATEPAAVDALKSQLTSPDEAIRSAAARALLASSAVNRKLALEHGHDDAIDAQGEEVPVRLVPTDEAQVKARAWLARKRLGTPPIDVTPDDDGSGTE